MTWQNNQSAPSNYNDLLGGGRATPSLTFKGQFPVTYTGLKLLEVEERLAYEYDPSKPGNKGAQKFWPDGNPVKYLWLTLQTGLRDPAVEGDDGRRVLVLDSKNKKEAVVEAVRESGADFAKNGTLDIEWYGNDPNSKNPDNPAKLYRARWAGPTFNDTLAQQAPPTSAAQGGWGVPAPAASPAPATGGWGGPQPAPQQQGWNAPAPAAQSGGWGNPAPAPAPDPTGQALFDAFKRKGVDPTQFQSEEQAKQAWQYVKNNPDVA